MEDANNILKTLLENTDTTIIDEFDFYDITDKIIEANEQVYKELAK